MFAEWIQAGDHDAVSRSLSAVLKLYADSKTRGAQEPSVSSMDNMCTLCVCVNIGDMFLLSIHSHLQTSV